MRAWRYAAARRRSSPAPAHAFRRTSSGGAMPRVPALASARRSRREQSWARARLHHGTPSSRRSTASTSPLVGAKAAALDGGEHVALEHDAGLPAPVKLPARRPLMHPSDMRAITRRRNRQCAADTRRRDRPAPARIKRALLCDRFGGPRSRLPSASLVGTPRAAGTGRN